MDYNQALEDMKKNIPKTAIGWYENKLFNSGFFQPHHKTDEIYKEAKQIEKQQIMDAYIMGSYEMARKEFNPEKYYNETYNK